MKRSSRIASSLIAAATVLAAIIGPASAAHAAASIHTGYRTCTGSSYVYTTGVASGNHFHGHVGPSYRERTFEGNPFVTVTTRYYSGAQGTYKGVIAASWGDVKSASISCDY